MRNTQKGLLPRIVHKQLSFTTGVFGHVCVSCVDHIPPPPSTGERSLPKNPSLCLSFKGRPTQKEPVTRACLFRHLNWQTMVVRLWNHQQYYLAVKQKDFYGGRGMRYVILEVDGGQVWAGINLIYAFLRILMMKEVKIFTEGITVPLWIKICAALHRFAAIG